MALERIDRLVSVEGFFFQAWEDRYSKGIWAALGTHETQIDVVRDLSSAGDLDMIPAMDYVLSANWLPYVTGNTLMGAMEALENRLSSLPESQLARSSEWWELTYKAIDDLATAYNDAKDYGGLQRTIPPNLLHSFEEARTQLQQAGDD